jgi:hypothetical protein
MRALLVSVACLLLLALVACDECEGKETKCDGEMILVCDDGQWQFLEHCVGPTDDFTCAPDCSEHCDDAPAKPCCVPGCYVPEV